MSKFRILHQDELESLKNEFVDFLVVNGITADEWINIKEKSIEDAQRIIELFSDVVFESILRKTIFLDFYSKDEWMVFQCMEKEFVLIGLRNKSKELDLTQFTANSEDFLKYIHEIEIYTTKKSIQENSREREMFEMLENGCSISDGSMFKKLALLL